MESTTKGLIDRYSSAVTLSTSTFFNFDAGSIFNFRVNGLFIVSTQLSTFSTNVGTNIQNVRDGINNALQAYLISTNSTVANLGTIGFVSSLSLASSIKELGTSGYASTLSLPSTVLSLQKLYPTQGELASTLQSTTSGLFARQQIISTQTLTSSFTSTTRGLELQTALTYVSTLGLTSSIRSTTSGIIGYLGGSGYISTPTLVSTYVSSFAFGISSLYTLRETLLSTLRSTTNATTTSNQLVFVSVPTFIAYASTLSNEGYINSNQFQSTVTGLLTQDNFFTSSLVIPQEFSQTQVKMSNFYFGNMTYDRVEYNQYFSSVQYEKLVGYASKFKTAQFVTIEYTPNIFFSELNNNYSNLNDYYISTIVQIGDTYYPFSRFRERSYFTVFGSNGTGPSNVYSRKMYLQMNKDDFLEAEENGFAIAHIFQNIIAYAQWTVSTQISLYTPRSNALFISIYN
jgi:hypothetical protein